MALVTKRIPKNPLLERCILYLYDLGYGKDSISLILKGAVKSGQIDRFLKESGKKRTISEAIQLRMVNKVLFSQGYDSIKARVKLLFPGLI
jgi:hypothetical protein